MDDDSWNLKGGIRKSISEQSLFQMEEKPLFLKSELEIDDGETSQWDSLDDSVLHMSEFLRILERY